jgi:hypothetical protein
MDGRPDGGLCGLIHIPECGTASQQPIRAREELLPQSLRVARLPTVQQHPGGGRRLHDGGARDRMSANRCPSAWTSRLASTAADDERRNRSNPAMSKDRVSNVMGPESAALHGAQEVHNAPCGI